MHAIQIIKWTLDCVRIVWFQCIQSCLPPRIGFQSDQDIRRIFAYQFNQRLCVAIWGQDVGSHDPERGPTIGANRRLNLHRKHPSVR